MYHRRNVLIFIQKLLSPDKYKSEEKKQEKKKKTRVTEKEDGIIDDNSRLQARVQENKTEMSKKARREIKFCICTHDLIRIYTDVVVSNKQ